MRVLGLITVMTSLAMGCAADPSAQSGQQGGSLSSGKSDTSGQASASDGSQPVTIAEMAAGGTFILQGKYGDPYYLDGKPVEITVTIDKGGEATITPFFPIPGNALVDSITVSPNGKGSELRNYYFNVFDYTDGTHAESLDWNFKDDLGFDPNWDSVYASGSTILRAADR